MALKLKNQFKVNEISIKDNTNHFIEKNDINQIFTKDLKDVLKTHSTLPTYTPKMFIDSFYLYFDGTTTYRLYIYINNEWKYTTLS